MLRLYSTTIAVSLAAFVIGCSKQQNPPSSHLPPNIRDSETVESIAKPGMNPAVTNEAGTNDLLAIALKTHTKQAWLNQLYHEIETDPDIDKEAGVNPRAGIRTIKAITNSSAAELFMTETNKASDAEKLQQETK